jgi:hypothetical protein
VFVPDRAKAGLNLAARERSIAAGRRSNAIAQTSGSA